MNALSPAGPLFEAIRETAGLAALGSLRPDGIRLPAAGEPLRVAFVGQRTYFMLCSQLSDSEAILPSFVEFRAEADQKALNRQLAAIDPHVIVAFRPELYAAAAFAGVDSLRLGVLTEPLPRTADAHPDLVRRLGEFALVIPELFDRIVTFDPAVIPTARRYAPIWRSVPLPVADEVFGWADAPSVGSPRVVFIGRSTPHRSGLLASLKHRHDLLHIEHGLFGEAFIEFAHAEPTIAINLHNEPYPSFENRVALHLAAGHVVVSEVLDPTHGLEAGIDFLEFNNPDGLERHVAWLLSTPGAFEMTRRRGRIKAERFRASSVWARVIHDLVLDVSVFGGRGS